MKRIPGVAVALLLYSTSFADVRPAKIFADSMVLQRGIKIPVWGWADRNEKITVQLNGQSKTVMAGNDGQWRTDLSPEKAGGPYQLKIRGNNTVVLNNILIGDVWICSGQSNMEWTVANAKNSQAEIASADLPMIRQIKISNATGEKPWSDIGNHSGWKTAVPANVASFTAVGYFFARELFNTLHVPIGLINTTWGGTEVETWISRQAFENTPEFAAMIARAPNNLDSLAQIHQKFMLGTIIKLQGTLADAATAATWKEPGISDSKWPHMIVPGLWEQQSLPDFDGIVWYRKEIMVPVANAGQEADITLGVIDDNDDTYVNGIKIGSTKGYNIKRVYHIPAGILQAGRNIIAVRVEDTGGGGGLYGDPTDMQLVMNNTKQALSGDWRFQVESIQKNKTIGPNGYPSLLYNAMLHPLIPYAIKGAIWYQGESNAGRAYQYRTAFPLMIKDWRTHWGQGDFPFYFVQLASFNSGNGNSERGSNWAELREAQALTLSVPNTGMAVTTDIGESKDIHPRNKQDVGKRLAAVALHNTYGRSDIVYSGPMYRSMTVTANKAQLFFNHGGSGLYAKNGTLNGFEIAGADRKFYPAKAVIDGDHLIVTSTEVPAPVAVRYAWADDAGYADFYNREGFPAVPFRTDKWKGITDTVTYHSGQ